MPNNPNDCGNNTISMGGFIMWDGRKYTIAPKIINRERPR